MSEEASIRNGHSSVVRSTAHLQKDIDTFPWEEATVE